MKQFKAEILSNTKIAPDHYILSFKAPKAAERTKPGQFFNVKVDSSHNPLLRRPFGAHKIDKSKIEILYKVVGKATRILSSRKKGETLDALGPLGNPFSEPGLFNPGSESVVLVAGGHGVAPLYGLAWALKANAVSGLTIMIGARTKGHAIGEKEFQKLGLKVRLATEDGTKGHKGPVTDLLKETSGRPTIYACGPKPMLKAVAKFAARHDIPCQVSLEEYVACGIGTCLGCAVKTRSGYKLVCKDGPVFDAKEIIW
jgi:dihydroorotate dehydrogenase electron transfer subunit